MAIDRMDVPIRSGLDGLLHDAFGDESHPLYRAVRRAIALVVLYGTGVMALESIGGLYGRYAGFFRISEGFMVGVFLIEYAGKVYVASPRRKYIFGRWGIIDLLSVMIAPLFVPFLDLRMFKLVRVLKLAQGATGAWRRAQDAPARALRTGVRLYIRGMFIVLVVGSTLVFYADSAGTGTRFTDIVNAMWWGVGAITPIDSGMSPETFLGRVFAAATAVCGLALFAFLINVIGGAMGRRGPDGLVEPDDEAMS